MYLSKKNDVKIITSSESQKRVETEIEGIPLLLLPYPPTSIRIRLAALRHPWVRESDVVIESADVGGPWFAFSARQRVLLGHQLWQDIFAEELRPPFGAILKWLEPAFYLPYRGTSTWVNSGSTEESFRALGITRIRRLPVGLQLGLNLSSSSQIFPAAPIPGKDLLQRPRVSVVSRLRKYKGIQLVLEAFPEMQDSYPDLELLIVGRGPYRERLEAFAKSLGISDSVRFLGYLSEPQRDEILRGSITTIAPSIREGLGLNVLEAFRCGTTCVGWDVPGTRDVISNGITGVLVKFGDLGALATAIKDLLSDPEKRDSLARSAFDQVSSIPIPESIDQVDEFIHG